MPQRWKQWEGQTLDGKFHLREYLGGSERSAVFLTGDRERGVEKAAIKLIPADPADAKLQLSRWKEAAKLSHPHLIRLFQTGRCRLEDRDLLYLVMEYAELDLSQVLSKVPFPPEETRETLRVVLDTLAYLHGKGFVHGRLKPANIMSVDGQLKLSSDGL
ncbi:MAG TPA: protein kinase, partial [Terriglobia bacterium]|nr:protein kinase [Terriglobia bacterium]